VQQVRDGGGGAAGRVRVIERTVQGGGGGKPHALVERRLASLVLHEALERQHLHGRGAAVVVLCGGSRRRREVTQRLRVVEGWGCVVIEGFVGGFAAGPMERRPWAVCVLCTLSRV
jgi:hypothetical protein